ncbi:hypothetical protein RUM43_003252 [Polyplax serrata]|uniref:Uncharacterized protein n=1 Tax=Polyplax serrata TaxID=468196 RepID=A0AAN8S334_POLSC
MYKAVDNDMARQQSLIDLEELYVWLQQFEDPSIGVVEELALGTGHINWPCFKRNDESDGLRNGPRCVSCTCPPGLSTEPDPGSQKESETTCWQNDEICC